MSGAPSDMSALPISGEVDSGHTNALSSSVGALLAFCFRDSKNKLFDDATVTAVGEGVAVTLVIDGETHDMQETRELVAVNPSAHSALQNKAESVTCAGDKQNGDRCCLKVALTSEYCHFHGLQNVSARIRGDGPLATKCASNVCSINAAKAAAMVKCFGCTKWACGPTPGFRGCVQGMGEVAAGSIVLGVCVYCHKNRYPQLLLVPGLTSGATKVQHMDLGVAGGSAPAPPPGTLVGPLSPSPASSPAPAAAADAAGAPLALSPSGATSDQDLVDAAVVLSLAPGAQAGGQLDVDAAVATSLTADLGPP
eukprot:CAMPEP_0198684514 /NCGR_PEP_ID=MMETSP1468-20131203/12320_1 /TAXON_ID=1461545 /ORGANISM="Mantoniella sp, Strain CCMP1436" /LENGTH=309 /DNA_ID=CAMNT_0044429381 /DNA_START=411 /DNA_END=1337 /DNA_ORIENTATION=-